MAADFYDAEKNLVELLLFESRQVVLKSKLIQIQKAETSTQSNMIKVSRYKTEVFFHTRRSYKLEDQNMEKFE